MSSPPPKGIRTKSILLLRQHRIISAFIGISLVLLSVFAIGILNVLITVNSFPNFAIENFRIVKVENQTVYTDLSFALFDQLDYTVRVNHIKCTIHSGSTPDLEEELATGSTIESLTVRKGSARVENLSFIFDVPDLELLLEVLLGDKTLTIQGQLFLEWGLSKAFKIQLLGIDTDFFPSISILEIHPLYPGSVLEVLANARNHHGITLNITTASFQLTSLVYGPLGTAYFENISIPPGRANITMRLHSNTSELAWLSKQILNNGTIHTKIEHFRGEFLFAGKSINVSVLDGPRFLWEDFSPSLEVQGISNVSVIGGNITFDVSLSFLGRPLWGYNLTCITFDFYHQLLNATLGPQIVGTGNLTETIQVPRAALVSVGIQINVFPDNVTQMLAVWVIEQKITLDIRNGIICLQFYKVSFAVGFTYTI